MVKKRHLYPIIIAFLLLIAIERSIAIEEVQIYSDWVYTGKNITADDKIFSFAFGGNPKTIVAKLPSGFGIAVDKGSCSQRDYYDICFDDTRIGYHNYTLDRDFYQASVKISQIIANLSLTRTIDRTNFLIGEYTAIKVKIENTGSKEAADIVYQDGFPPSLAVFGPEGVEIEDNAAVWKGSLGENLKKEFSYKIKAVSYADYKSIANLTFNDGSAARKTTDSATISVPDYQFKIELNLSKSKAEPNEALNLTVTVSNWNTERPMNVMDFYIYLPNLDIIKYTKSLAKEQDKYKWAGSLEPLESKAFQFELKGTKSKVYLIEAYGGYIINNLRQDVKKTADLNVLMPNISVSYEISEKILGSGEKSNIMVYVTNPSAKTTFKNLALSIKTDLPGESLTKTKDELKPLDTKIFLNKEITAPAVEEETTYPLEIIISYEADGKTISFEKIEEITVLAAVKEENKTEEITPVTENTTQNLTSEKNASFIIENPEKPGPKDKPINILKNVIGIILLIIVISAGFIVFIHEKRLEIKKRKEKESKKKTKLEKIIAQHAILPEIKKGASLLIKDAARIFKKKEIALKEKEKEVKERVKESSKRLKVIKNISKKLESIMEGKVDEKLEEKPKEEMKAGEKEELEKNLLELEKIGREKEK